MAQDDFSDLAVKAPSPRAPAVEDFSDLATPVGVAGAPESGSRIGAFAQGVGGGALQGAGMVAGGLSGVSIGAPAGPLGMIVGGVAGAYLGMQAGKEARGAVGLAAPQDMDPNLRPAATAGETFGASLPFAGLPFGAAATGMSMRAPAVGEVGYKWAESYLGTATNRSAVGNLVNSIINTAKAAPGRTAAAELAAASGAAVGAGVAEFYAPGRQDVRAVGELVGPFAVPGSIAISAWKSIATKGRQLAARFSSSAQQTEAAKWAQSILIAAGEDPAVVAKILRQRGLSDDLGVPLTAAQKSGSFGLRAQSDYLARVNKQYGLEEAKRAEDALDALRGTADLLTRTGDPEALKLAAEARGLYIRTLISGRVEMAKQEALSKAGVLLKDGRELPGARDKLGLQAREALDMALKDAEKVEDELWAAVPKDVRIRPSSIIETWDRIVADTVPEYQGRLPKEVRAFVSRMRKEVEGDFQYNPETLEVAPMEPIVSISDSTLGELYALRSQWLREARIADRNPDTVGQARVFNSLAEAAMKDIDAVMAARGDSDYDTARLFTREKSDTFTRSFAGSALATSVDGERIDPELLLNRALATGAQGRAYRLKELEDATTFLLTRGYGDDNSHQLMMNAQRDFLRIAAADSLDPTTGRANPDRINKFIRDNRELMARFPEVKMELQAAVKSEEGLRTVENFAKNTETLLQRQAVFGSMFGGSTANTRSGSAVAIQAANRALVSPDQESELIRLIDFAKKGATGRGGRILFDSKRTVDGLKASIYQAALDKSQNRDGSLNLERLQSLLATPSGVGRKSVMQVMQEQGILSTKEVQDFRNLFDLASNVQKSQAGGASASLNVESSLNDAVTTLIARIAGSKTASSFQNATGGGNSASLIIHGAAARFAEQVARKIPLESVNKIMVEAMLDPQKMALLLERPTNAQQASMQARRIHAWLVQSNLMQLDDVMQPEYQQPTTPPPQMFSIPR